MDEAPSAQDRLGRLPQRVVVLEVERVEAVEREDDGSEVVGEALCRYLKVG